MQQTGHGDRPAALLLHIVEQLAKGSVSLQCLTQPDTQHRLLYQHGRICLAPICLVPARLQSYMCPGRIGWPFGRHIRTDARQTRTTVCCLRLLRQPCLQRLSKPEWHLGGQPVCRVVVAIGIERLQILQVGQVLVHDIFSRQVFGH